MKFVVLADDDRFSDISSGNNDLLLVRVGSVAEFKDYADATAFFNLQDDASRADYPSIEVPLFVNSVAQIAADKSNITRINGWSGFLQNETWEIAGRCDAAVEAVLKALGKKHILVADVPGLISAGIIAMIINEACFAKEDDISTEGAIDTAMKLGTNYPFGPFEWAEKIGWKNIFELLVSMSARHIKYAPALIIQNRGNR